MTDELAEKYELIINNLMGHEPGLATVEMDKLTRPELDEVFERALLEQEAREELREMAIVRMMRLLP